MSARINVTRSPAPAKPNRSGVGFPKGRLIELPSTARRLTQGQPQQLGEVRDLFCLPVRHVSRSTLKRTLEALAQKKLVRVAFQAKQASLFAVCERPLTPKGKSDLGFAKPRLYDFFSLEDRALFLSTKRSLAPAVTQEIEAEASDPYEVDVVIFRRYFGPDRQRKYAHLLEGGQNGP